MKTDPILKEVYRMKDEFAREIDNDPKKLCALLRECAKEHPERMVNLQAREKKTNVDETKAK